jgi:HTH-type transcriptional regulator/antitoxin HigA
LEIAAIKNWRDYRRALKKIDGLIAARRNTPEVDRLEALVALVEVREQVP